MRRLQIDCLPDRITETGDGAFTYFADAESEFQHLKRDLFIQREAANQANRHLAILRKEALHLESSNGHLSAKMANMEQELRKTKEQMARYRLIDLVLKHAIPIVYAVSAATIAVAAMMWVL